jgi:hypothetical protein
MFLASSNKCAWKVGRAWRGQANGEREGEAAEGQGTLRGLR